MQHHEYSIEIAGNVEEVWSVFWNPDRPTPTPPTRRVAPWRVESFRAQIEILHPGDVDGNGLVRHCWFPVPWWLGSGGVGESWEWLTEVRPHESWRYDAVGKPLWSRAQGFTRLEPVDAERTTIHFSETYHAFNPVMRVLFERRVHEAISRDNDEMISLIESAVRWRRKHREVT
jgi:hypothetical protein